jgi:hypothetical protein
MFEPLTAIGTVLLYLILICFAGGSLIWAIFYSFGLYRDSNPKAWDKDDVQVRIVTRGDHPQVVKETAESASHWFNDIKVVTDKQIEIPIPAEIFIVPGSFHARAKHKGRALVWASRNIPCDKEYILYLDEDTIVTGFEGLPDEDIVQILEKPRQTESRLTHLIEVTRIGFQQEVKGFPLLAYPMYLWGGAFAVRKSVEDDVGWNVNSVTEDTLFLWRAMADGYTYTAVEQRYENQSPLSIVDLIKQRRRWVTGTIDSIKYLPLHWTPIVWMRTLFWLVSVFTICVIVAGLTKIILPLWLSIVFVIPPLIWSVIGSSKYEHSGRLILLTFFLFPLIHTIGSLGVVYALVKPSRSFDVTKKK